MSDESTSRLRAEFDALRERGRAERDERLRQIEDAELREELEALLGACDRDDSPLDRPAFVDADGLVAAGLGRVANDPDVIADFRILQRLASGGMGVVYLAEQDRPRRTVALKLLRGDLVSPSLLRRFLLEAELLGRLRHPGIAQIYETGTADAGSGEQPYIAMELVEGQRITDHARERNLDLRARVELLRAVCDAVHHAHLRGVIHRDLKPDNVLVAEGGTGAIDQPKVLDFGVARATDADVQLTTVQTDVGQLVGTVPYMSPEQLGGDPAAIDTRSDVYALGVLLFELLTGRLPHDVRGLSIPDAALAIREQDPTSLASLDTTYRGDLDTIVAKALEKEAGRRYESAAELSEDLRRFLANEPIAARPPSTWYQVSRFCRRHRVLVDSAATVALVMVVAIAVLAGTTLRATRAEADANLRLAEAEAIAEFYDGILLTLRTIGAGPDVTVMQMADEMAQRVAADIAEHPLIRARVEYTLGSVYRDLGQYPQAAEFFRRCYDTRLAKLGLEATETRSAGVDLGTALSGADRGAEALALFEELTPIVERYDGRDDPRTITVKMELANVLDDNPQTSERSYEIYDEVYADLEASGRLATEQGCVLLANSGLLAIRLGKLDEAEARLKRAIEIGRGDVDFAFSRTAAALGHLGHLYVTQERFEEAEPLLTEAYEFDRTNMGEEFIGTNMNGDKLAVLMTRLGKYDRADELLTRGIANLTETLGPGHRYTLRLRQHQIELRVSEGRYDEALDLADAAIVHANTAQGEPNLWTPLFMDRKGHAYRFAGDDESADRMHAEGIEIRDRVDTQAPKSTPAPPPR